MTQSFAIDNLDLSIVGSNLSSPDDLVRAYRHAYRKGSPEIVEFTIESGVTYRVTVAGLVHESGDDIRHLFIGYVVSTSKGRARSNTLQGHCVAGSINVLTGRGHLRVSRQFIGF